MDLKSYLDEMGFRYLWSCHSDVFTSQQLAQAEHIPGDHVVKPVLVKADGEFLICALPASQNVDLARLKAELQAQVAELAGEEELSAICCDCEVGAQPPVGWLFGLPTLIDESLMDDDRVTFQAGTHKDAVTMTFLDYFRLARPAVGNFGLKR